jgi:hypothetical protein
MAVAEVRGRYFLAFGIRAQTMDKSWVVVCHKPKQAGGVVVGASAQKLVWG